MRAAWETRVLARTVALLVVLAVAGCASGGGGAATRGSANRITAEEMAEHASLDLYAVVQRLRPRWLQVRGATSVQGRAAIAVILDGVRQQGSIELLRGLRASDIREVRFLGARDATTRYGTDMTAGAIEVFTKR
jgi:hypothetical protein